MMYNLHPKILMSWQFDFLCQNVWNNFLQLQNWTYSKITIWISDKLESIYLKTRYYTYVEWDLFFKYLKILSYVTILFFSIIEIVVEMYWNICDWSVRAGLRHFIPS